MYICWRSRNNIPRGSPPGLCCHWPSSGSPRPPRGACREHCSDQTCGSRCSPWFCGLGIVRVVSNSRWRGWNTTYITFHLAILANIRGSLGALSSWMTFLVADPASTLEHARLWAVHLSMAIGSSVQARMWNSFVDDLPFLATVEASHGLARFRTLASKVAFVATAEGMLDLVRQSITGVRACGRHYHHPVQRPQMAQSRHHRTCYQSRRHQMYCRQSRSRQDPGRSCWGLRSHH